MNPDAIWYLLTPFPKQKAAPYEDFKPVQFPPQSWSRKTVNWHIFKSLQDRFYFYLQKNAIFFLNLNFKKKKNCEQILNFLEYSNLPKLWAKHQCIILIFKWPKVYYKWLQPILTSKEHVDAKLHIGCLKQTFETQCFPEVFHGGLSEHFIWRVCEFYPRFVLVLHGFTIMICFQGTEAFKSLREKL